MAMDGKEMKEGPTEIYIVLVIQGMRVEDLFIKSD
jgi:hypothetical protein